MNGFGRRRVRVIKCWKDSMYRIEYLRQFEGIVRLEANR